MKKALPLLYLLLFSYFLIAQQKDYTNIKFKSKLRSYTKTKPKAKELGIEKQVFTELADLLTLDSFTEKEKKDLANKLWLAAHDPKKFDFVYKDFSLKTIKNWGVKIKFEDINFEPNPYLAEWTNNGDDFLYIQWAVNQILTYTQIMTYSEKAKVAQKNIHDLILLKNMKFYPARSNEFAYDYLHRNNEILRKKGLTILIYNNNFDYTVCRIEDKEKVIELFAKLKWEFVVP